MKRKENAHVHVHVHKCVLSLKDEDSLQIYFAKIENVPFVWYTILNATL